MVLGDGASVLILVLFLGAVVIAIIALVIWLLRSLSKSRGLDLNERLGPAVSAPAPSAEPPLLGLRRNSVGRWLVEVQGRPYDDLQAVPDDAIRRDVVAGLRELATFARGYIQANQGAASSAPVTQPAPSAPAVASSVRDPAPSRARNETKRAPTADSRRLSEPTLMPVIDLAGEITDILEEMRVHIPMLQHRSILLANALDGGIEFRVDGKSYSELREIPDLDVRALIQKAIQEWERRR